MKREYSEKEIMDARRAIARRSHQAIDQVMEREARWYLDEQKVTSSCGCIFCDLKLDLHEDAQGFHHVAPGGERVMCAKSVACGR